MTTTTTIHGKRQRDNIAMYLMNEKYLLTNEFVPLSCLLSSARCGNYSQMKDFVLKSTILCHCKLFSD